MRRTSIMTAMLITCVIALAPANATQRFSLPNGQNSVPVIQLAAMVSRPGEGKQEFLLRAGANMSAFTEQTHVETCSIIYQSPDKGHALLITTSGSQLGCAYLESPMHGFTATDETIHTHPSRKSGSITARDRLFLGGEARGAMSGEFEPNRFSEADYDMGPGYMVSGDTVRFQDGKRERTVGKVGTPDTEAINSWIVIYEADIRKKPSVK